MFVVDQGQAGLQNKWKTPTPCCPGVDKERLPRAGHSNHFKVWNLDISLKEAARWIATFWPYMVA